MLKPARFAFATALVAALGLHNAYADKKTVCTITVNSADEKEAFRRNLPPDKYDFVELVERGRPDWLASACSRRVRCDVLVISGHYDGGKEFFPDSLSKNEFLPVDEMERVSCSDSCPGLFSQLKEVHLYGCNTLNPESVKSVSAEIGRSLLRSGHSRADVERLTRLLGTRHGESSRDRMRLIFKDVPAIYGFSSVAPLGPTAASLLERHFRTSGIGEVGSGRASARLLGQFAGKSMAVTNGLKDGDPQAAHRRDVCQFADDRLTPAQKLDFVHQLMGREVAEVRMFLDRIEKQTTSLTEAERNTPDVAQALDAIANDRVARDRYLNLARDADQLATRVRMLDVASSVGWLAPAEHRAELMRMIGEQVANNAVGSAEVDLVCRLNQDHRLDQDAARLIVSPAQAVKVGPAAVLACLGDAESHPRVLLALTSAYDNDVQIAQVYLRHRPIADVNELREVTTGIARMNGSAAQVRALEALAGLRVSDPESLDALARLFPVAESPGVQSAIAGVFIRSDYKAIDRPELVQTLRQYRRKSREGDDLIDVLIRRLELN